MKLYDFKIISSNLALNDMFLPKNLYRVSVESFYGK